MPTFCIWSCDPLITILIMVHSRKVILNSISKNIICYDLKRIAHWALLDYRNTNHSRIVTSFCRWMPVNNKQGSWNLWENLTIISVITEVILNNLSCSVATWYSSLNYRTCTWFDSALILHFTVCTPVQHCPFFNILFFIMKNFRSQISLIRNPHYHLRQE